MIKNVIEAMLSPYARRLPGKSPYIEGIVSKRESDLVLNVDILNVLVYNISGNVEF